MSTTRRRRPALIALATVGATGCMLLAWWQWTRYESNSGTFLNLGYALQWPMFAAFCVYAYYKFVRLEEAPPTYEEPEDTSRATEIPAGLLPERPKAAVATAATDDDQTLRDYNAYLAELAKSDDNTEDRK